MQRTILLGYNNTRWIANAYNIVPRLHCVIIPMSRMQHIIIPECHIFLWQGK